MAKALRSSDGGLSDPLRLYLEAIGRESLLTKEEEAELAIAIEHCHEAEDELTKNGSLKRHRREQLERVRRRGMRARERFISANLRLVVSIATRYQNQGLPLLDLIQEGNLGLIHAVEKFDWRKGFKFSTYATWWIRQAIQRGIGNKARTIRLPVHMEEQVRKLDRKRNELSQRIGRDPTEEELALAVALPVEEVKRLTQAARELRPVSLHERVGDTETELQELIADVSADAPYDVVEETLVREDLEEALETQLDERERKVVAMRFGFWDGISHSLQEIGEELGLSRERIRQIEGRALEKLRTGTALTGNGSSRSKEEAHGRSA